MARTTASSKSDRRISSRNNHTQPDEEEKTVVDLFKDMTRKVNLAVIYKSEAVYKSS